MTGPPEPKPSSQTEHSPRTKAIVIAVGMVIGLVLLYFVMQVAGRPPGPPR